MSSSPTGGWGFAGHTFKDRAVLAGLEVKRMEAYEAAAGAECLLAATHHEDDRADLLEEKERWYQEATRLEAEIKRISGDTE